MSKAIVKKPSFHTQRYYNPWTNTYTTDVQYKKKGKSTHEITSVAPNSFSKTTIIEMQDPERFSKMVKTTQSAYKSAMKNNENFIIDKRSLPSEIYDMLLRAINMKAEKQLNNLPTIHPATPQQIKNYKRQKAQQASRLKTGKE
jgi:RNase adaptor protein for sRNA GlmZ degradation